MRNLLDTPLRRMLGVRYPIIGGTMMDLSMPPFVAAICEAGALGIIPSASFHDYNAFRDALREVRDRTDAPFAVNINLFPMMKKLDNLRYLEILVEQGVRVVETSGFAPPADLVQRFQDAGLTWLHKCVGVRYALKAQKLGASAVTLVGYENGGATGNLNISTMVLTASAVDQLAIPVIGGGGVVDGRTFLAVMALGAQGAIIGTRLMLSDECPVHDNVKRALVGATELDTDVIMRSVGFAHRVWMNEASRRAAEVEAAGGGLEELYPHVSGEAAREMYRTGETSLGSIACSQAVGLIHSIKPVAEIIQEIVEQAGQRLEHLTANAAPAAGGG